MDVLGYVAKQPEVFQEVSSVLLGKDNDSYEFTDLYIAGDCFESVDPIIQDQFKELLDFLSSQFKQSLNFQVAEEGLDHWINTFRLIQGYEVWESYGGWIDHHRPCLSRGPKERLEWAKTITRQTYLDAKEKRQSLIDTFQRRFPKQAILVLPTTSSVAPLRTDSLDTINHYRAQSTNLLCISPLTNTPQITVPMLEYDGVPLGVTFITREGTDMALVKRTIELYQAWKQS
jgi:amidase